MKIEISAKCPVCGKISKHSYDKDAYNKYMAGEIMIIREFSRYYSFLGCDLACSAC